MSKRGRAKSHSAKLAKFLSKRLRLLILSLAVVLGVVLVFGGVYLYQYFKTSYSLASGVGPALVGDLEVGGNFNLLLFKVDDLKSPTTAINEAALINFQVEKGTANLLKIGADEEFWLPSRTGRVKLGSLYGLGNLSGQGTLFWQKALSLELGLPIDGAIYTDNDGFYKIVDLAQSLRSGGGVLKAFRLAGFLGPVVRTNLNWRSLGFLLSFVSLNFPRQIEVYNARSLVNFFDPKIERERLKIIVLNGTRAPRLATDLGRLAVNLGTSLLSTDNAPDGQLYQSSLLIAQSRDTYGVTRLAQMLGLKDIRLAKDVTVESKLSRLLRADLVLIAGADQVDGARGVDR